MKIKLVIMRIIKIINNIFRLLFNCHSFNFCRYIKLEFMSLIIKIFNFLIDNVSSKFEDKNRSSNFFVSDIKNKFEKYIINYYIII